jgi:hypothetical protein
MYAGVGPGSFYVRAPDPVVWNSTGARKNQTIKMYTFMLRDVFVWHPAAIFQGDGYPACPKCKTKLPSLVQYHGWGDYREVVCKSTCIQLITTRYKCFNYGCTAGTFHAYDSDVLSQYPAYIKHAFPFFLTQCLNKEVLWDLKKLRKQYPHHIGLPKPLDFTSIRKEVEEDMLDLHGDFFDENSKPWEASSLFAYDDDGGDGIEEMLNIFKSPDLDDRIFPIDDLESVVGDHSLLIALSEAEAPAVQPERPDLDVTVKLDVFHAMHRLLEGPTRKQHGAYLTFAVLLRDCFFLVSRSD